MTLKSKQNKQIIVCPYSICYEGVEMTRHLEGKITDIDIKQWAGIDYGVLKLQLRDGSIVELGINQKTFGPKPKLGVTVWVEITDQDPPLILRLKSPELDEPEKKKKSIMARQRGVRGEGDLSKPSEFISKPIGINMIAIYIEIVGVTFLLLPGAFSFFSHYAGTFYVWAVVCTVFSFHLWQVRRLSRWIAIPILILPIIYFYWISTWGLIVIILSTISIIYLIRPSTGIAIDAWRG